MNINDYISHVTIRNCLIGRKLNSTSVYGDKLILGCAKNFFKKRSLTIISELLRVLLQFYTIDRKPEVVSYTHCNRCRRYCNSILYSHVINNFNTRPPIIKSLLSTAIDLFYPSSTDRFRCCKTSG